MFDRLVRLSNAAGEKGVMVTYRIDAKPDAAGNNAVGTVLSVSADGGRLSSAPWVTRQDLCSFKQAPKTKGKKQEDAGLF